MCIRDRYTLASGRCIRCADEDYLLSHLLRRFQVDIKRLEAALLAAGIPVSLDEAGGVTEEIVAARIGAAVKKLLIAEDVYKRQSQRSKKLGCSATTTACPHDSGW